MTSGALLCLTLLAAADRAEVRTLAISASQKSGPVEGLVPDELVVLENGVAREVVSVEPEARPLTLILVLDTSAAVADGFRLHMVGPLVDFVKRLPAGTVYSVWTTGDRPTRLVELTDDRTRIGSALGRVQPQGGSRLLDALVEAAQDGKDQREGRRTVVLAVTAHGPEFSDRDKRRVVDQAAGLADEFLAVQLETGGASFETEADYAFVLDQLTRRTGGRSESLLSAMSLESGLDRLAAHLGGAYTVRYATPADLGKRKLEVKVARPDVRIVLRQPERAAAR